MKKFVRQTGALAAMLLVAVSFAAVCADKANAQGIRSGELWPDDEGNHINAHGGGSVLGWVGEIHPLAATAFEAEAPVVAFELDLNALEKAARVERETQEVSQFPPVTMDVAFVVDEAVTHEKLLQTMQSAGGNLLDSVQLFDVYRDKDRLGAGKKSMAYALEYRAPDRTLEGEEAESAHARLVKKVCGATGAEVRA